MAEPGKAVSFDSEFDQFNKDRIRVRCSTCNLPDDMKAWVDGKIKAGASAQSLGAFLVSKGFKVSSSAIINHKNAHVS